MYNDALYKSYDDDNDDDDDDESAILLWQIRPSVRPSVILWHHCVETNEHIVELFPPSGRGVNLVFVSASAVTQF